MKTEVHDTRLAFFTRPHACASSSTHGSIPLVTMLVSGILWNVRFDVHCCKPCRFQP